MPDDRGGGTQQRAAACLRALAACGPVHLLHLASTAAPLPAHLHNLVASTSNLADAGRVLGRALRFADRRTWMDRVLTSAWGTSGLIAPMDEQESAALGASLPRQDFDGLFAFHLGAACAVEQLQALRPRARRVIDWDFLESANVVPLARAENPSLGVRQTLSAHFNRLKVQRLESRILRDWDAHMCSSSVDVPHLRHRARPGAQVFSVRNTAPVPAVCSPPPPAERPPTVLFVGTMAYWPNLDAAQHFLDDIWPAVRRALPLAEVLVVGRAAPASLLARSGRDGITVHADVPDMAPLYALSHAAVVPLRFAVGSNLKIPEAMASGRPVVAYRPACERHAISDDSGVLPVDGAQAFTDAVLTLLSNTGQAANLGAKAHQAALANFSRTVVERDLTQALKIIFE